MGGAIGWLVAGMWGAGTGMVGAVAAAWPARRGGRLPGALGVGLLAASAVATVLEEWPDRAGVDLGFALRRELTGQLGSAAAVLLLVALGAFIVDERDAHDDGEVGPEGDGPDRSGVTD